MKARKAFPEDSQVAKALGRAIYKRGEYASAMAHLQQAAQLLPEDAEAQHYLGMTYYKQGNKARSRQILNRALQLGLAGDLASEATSVLVDTK